MQLLVTTQIRPLLSHVFHEELRIAETFLVDDELAEDKPRVSVAVRAEHRVEGDTAVGLARLLGVDRLTAGV